MKKFFEEFKKFITRGNVLDMSVGVIVGGAFTGIVNGLSNFILKPLINFLLALVLGGEGLSGAISMLSPAYVIDTVTGTKTLDLAHSIYIDWGAFISAIINFLIIAFVLFTIVKIMNNIRDNNGKLTEMLKKNTLDRAERKELKQAGVNLKDKNAVKKYFEDKQKAEELAKEQARLEEEEKARIERLNNPTTEDLLTQIKVLLENNLKGNN
jgi:large conductance mechanosensitive channel